jgi:hypothetical protein
MTPTKKATIITVDSISSLLVRGVVVGCGRCRQTNQPPTLFAAVVPRLTGLRP